VRNVENSADATSKLPLTPVAVLSFGKPQLQVIHDVGELHIVCELLKRAIQFASKPRGELATRESGPEIKVSMFTQQLS